MRPTSSFLHSLHGIALAALLVLAAGIPARAETAAAAVLPRPGDRMSLAQIKELSAQLHWDDLQMLLANHPLPENSLFVVGSCVGWSDEWLDPKLHRAWLQHSLTYWAGMPDDEVARLKADTDLMLAVSRVLDAQRDGWREEHHGVLPPTAAAQAQKAIVVFNRARVVGVQSDNCQQDNQYRWGSARLEPHPSFSATDFLKDVILPHDVAGFVRPYEPTEIGYRQDRRDDAFMDFQLSVMFPLYGQYPEPLPPKLASHFNFANFDPNRGNLFASATIGGGQYIKTRPSSPVVGKRFNPQVFVRFWALDENGQATSPDNYFDLIYGHESNGQAISKEADFLAQKAVYRALMDSPILDPDDNAGRWARDSISRGTDYIGTEWGWSWKAKEPIVFKGIPGNVERSLKVKVRYFLPWGFLQRHAEQYFSWEGEGQAHPRRNYDGIKVQYMAVGNWFGKWPLLTGRNTYTYTTGLSHPFTHSSFEADLGLKIGRVPLSIWGRIGYNSDLTDYYHWESGWGFRLSIWQY